jgi:glycyl-tRNA synthetase
LLLPAACSAVRAVLAERGDNPALASSTAAQLQAALDAGDGSPLRSIMAALSRPTRIVRGKTVDPSVKVNASLFENTEEKQLYAVYEAVSQQLNSSSSSSSSSVDVAGWLAAVQGLVGPINAFFEKVFVMCEDEKVRANRLALLRDVAGVTKGFVDLSQLPGF